MNNNFQNTNNETFEWQPITDRDTKTKNFWDYSKETVDDLDHLTKVSPVANIVLPIALIVGGFYFIYQQFAPDIQQRLREETGQLAQGTVSPVADEYISLSEYISNPQGLDSLTQQALSENVLQEDTQSLNYQGTFYISIPALGMERLPIDANIDSASENAYLTALEDSLAHFKYTGLPVSDVQNNIVVYGHSASPGYNPQRNDPVVAFSYLQELKVGDDIFIEIEGETHQFKMQRSSIVEPDAVEIITGTPGKRTLTLFTCFPNGSNSKRYVAVARAV